MERSIIMSMICMAFIAMLVPRNEAKCDFEAMFIFGDSNSDTGGSFSAFPSQSPPYGISYFKQPTGRFCDGRLYVDFLAQALGFPFPSPYLQSIGSDFRHGANFAISGSTVLPFENGLFNKNTSPFSLAIQLNQMKQFKTIVDGKSKGPTSLPSSDIFGKSLYIIYSGQNDFVANLQIPATGGVQPQLPQVVSLISGSIKELYSLGGRTFLVLNLAPLGCYPAYQLYHPHASSDIDSLGCSITTNNAVNNYNNLLKESLTQTRQNLSDARVIYVNTYDMVLNLYKNPSSHGIEYRTKACCGAGDDTYNFNFDLICGKRKLVNGKLITIGACSNPQKYVSWDGVHLTEAVNKLVAYSILNGSKSEPPFSLNQYCDIQPIG